MASICIWNSITRRRRSASDTFEENGLQIIKAYLESVGHTVKITDWATNEGYNSLSPFVLRKINKFLFTQTIKQKGLPKTISGILLSVNQGFLNLFQTIRIRKKLRSLAKEIKKNGIRFLGIKVWYGEAFIWSRYLTALINRYSPETIVIAGGYHATLYEEDILKYSNFDLAVAGEGEYILKELLDISSQFPDKDWCKTAYLEKLNAILNQSPIPGLIYRDNGGIKKINRSACDNELNYNKTHPLYRKDSGKVKVHILIESLGCPWGKCNFCVHNQFVQGYRKRNIPDMIQEIRDMTKQGIGLFRFTGSDTPPQYGKTIGEAIIGNNLHIEYTMGSRAVKNSKDPDVFGSIVQCYKTMIISGLRGVFIGGETGNDFINEAVMNKGISAEDIIYTIKAIREAEKLTGEKVTISLALIYPPPLNGYITLEDIKRDNLFLLKECIPDAVMVSPPAPFKNSTWYNQKEAFGFNLGKDFIRNMMEYEYVLYKPLTMWPDLDIKVHETSFKEILTESQHFRQIVEQQLGIPTDLSDEHFLIIRCAGLLHEEGIKSFKRNSLISIVSCDYSYINKINASVSEKSRMLALKNN